MFDEVLRWFWSKLRVFTLFKQSPIICIFARESETTKLNRIQQSSDMFLSMFSFQFLTLCFSFMILTVSLSHPGAWSRTDWATLRGGDARSRTPAHPGAYLAASVSGKTTTPAWTSAGLKTASGALHTAKSYLLTVTPKDAPSLSYCIVSITCGDRFCVENE